MARVANKIAFITGGSQGIGAQTARLLAHEGAIVIITDILDDLGKQLAAELGPHTVYYHLDASCEKNWQEVIAKVQAKYHKLDILFNNAGIIGLDPKFGPQDPEHASLDSWRHIHSINLDSVFLGCKYGISLMKTDGGSIINMSSRSGIVGVPGTAAYASSKAAIRNHSKTVALYCAQKKYRIRCNSIHPAAILTPLWDAIVGTDPNTRENNIKKITQGIPLGHMGDTMDVAYAVLYLGSDESKFITGAELTIDGGILAGSSAAPQKK